MRQQLQSIMGLGAWRSLSAGKLEDVLAGSPAKLRKGWDALLKKRAALPADEKVCALCVCFEVIYSYYC